MHLDQLETTVWEMQGQEAPPARSELYVQLAQCISQLLTWLRLACERCKGRDQQSELVVTGDQVPVCPATWVTA